MMYLTSNTWVIQFAMYLKCPFHMSTGPIFVIFQSTHVTYYLTQPNFHCQYNQYHCCINQSVPVNTPSFFSTALLNHRSSACSSGCQALNNTWTHVPSCPSSPRSPRQEAVNLSEMLSVLSAVYWLSLLYPGCILTRTQTPRLALCGLLADLTI